MVASGIRALLVGRRGAERPHGTRDFAENLTRDLERLGVSTELVPTLGFGRGLRCARASGTVVHVLDERDAAEVPLVRDTPTVVTCHGPLPNGQGTMMAQAAAWRGAVSTWRAKHGLFSARALVSDTDHGAEELEAALGPNAHQLRARIYPALRFRLAHATATELPSAVVRLGRPFVLHADDADSGRHAAVDCVARVPGELGLVFAGEAPSQSLRARLRERGLAERAAFVEGTDRVLTALYRRSHCLLATVPLASAPWVVLEAQAAGCPVVAAASAPLLELARGAALFADPNDTSELACQIAAAGTTEVRARLIAEGAVNAERFRRIDLGREYVAIYEQLLAVRPSEH
jgi:glycosyltransferase involved in cell wall biosynthesis